MLSGILRDVSKLSFIRYCNCSLTSRLSSSSVFSIIGINTFLYISLMFLVNEYVLWGLFKTSLNIFFLAVIAVNFCVPLKTHKFLSVFLKS